MQFKEEFVTIHLNNLLNEEAMNWLKKNNFFKAPASSKYHLAYEAGLFEHSKNVAKTLAVYLESSTQ